MHTITSTSQRRQAASRTGFTLVELLVVIGVLIILTVMTMSLVNATQNEDRVRAGAATIQSFMEGARDRAIHAKQPRGIRFLTDSNAPNLATSMIYIGAPEVYGKGLQATVTMAPDFDPATETVPRHAVRPQNPQDLSIWWGFHNRGLISNGTPIQIEGQFYTIRRVKYSTMTRQFDFFQLTKPFVSGPSSGLKYSLFLNPTVLPNQEPRQLPRAVVIDLNSSYNNGHLPRAWGQPGSYNSLDVLFSPNGTVTGLVASAGVIHLVVADVVDVDNNLAVGNTAKEGNERIVSLRTQTGNISVHSVDQTGDPFKFAAEGKVAQ